MKPENIWVSRYDPQLPDLADRLRFMPPILTGLHKLHPADAGERLSRTMRDVFVPGDQHCKLAREMLATARAYAAQMYCSDIDFLKTAYAENLPEPSASIFCITGLSGVGKTSFETALGRLFPVPVSVKTPNHEEFALQGIWTLEAEERCSLRTLMKPYVGCKEVHALRSTSDFEECVRHQLYLRGVCLITLGELQFVAKSSSSCVMIVNLIMQLMRLGPPFSFAANYSLIHKLRQRPEEEYRRLLARVREIEPDVQGSADWAVCCSAILRVAPEFSELSSSTHGNALHDFTFGVRGRLARLLVIAYLIARNARQAKVSRAHLEAAYSSRDYADERHTVKLLERQSVEGGPVRDSSKRWRRDLWYPARERPSNVVIAQNSIDKHRERLHEAMVQASCTVGERAQLAAKANNPSAKSSAGDKVSPIRRRKSIDKDSLVAAAAQFRLASTGKRSRNA